MARLRWLHPILFATTPVLFLVASNSDEASLSQAGRSLALAAGVTAGLALLLMGWFRHIDRAVFLTTVMIGFFWIFVQLVNALETVGSLPLLSHWLILALDTGILASLAYVLRKSRRSFTATNTLLSVIAASLFLLQLAQLTLTWRTGNRTPADTRAEPTTNPAQASSRPDIYFILLDGYARSDVMREIYGYDNGEFTRWLESRGFQVLHQGRANYCKTIHALASVLNFDYLQELAPLPEESVRTAPLLDLIRRNRVVHTLRQHGYSIVAFASGYEQAEFSNPDYYLKPSSIMSEFESVLLSLTPIPYFLPQSRNAHALHRKRLQYILEKLPRVSEGESPRFVFAHLLAPHPPFVFGERGQPRTPSRAFAFYDGSDFVKHGGSTAEYVDGYAQQARYVTERLRSLLQDLLDKYGDRPPVIVLQSDHGPGSQLDWKDLSKTNVKERFGIFSAMLLPGVELQVPEQFSPVNTFRLLFDVYLGTNLGPLEDRSFYTLQARPLQYHDVSDSPDW